MENFPKSFNYAQVNEKHFRSDIKIPGQVYQWLKEYSELTKTRWINKFYPREFFCQYISRMHVMCHRASRMNSSLRLEKSETFSCEAQILIIIKKSTHRSLIKDLYFKDGYPAIIEFIGEHNHPTNDEGMLPQLSSREEIKTMFLNYFKKGLNSKNALIAHKVYLQSIYKHDSIALIDGAIVPDYRIVNKWFSDFIRHRPSIPIGTNSNKEMMKERHTSVAIKKKTSCESNAEFCDCDSENFCNVDFCKCKNQNCDEYCNCKKEDNENFCSCDNEDNEECCNCDTEYNGEFCHCCEEEDIEFCGCDESKAAESTPSTSHQTNKDIKNNKKEDGYAKMIKTLKKMSHKFKTKKTDIYLNNFAKNLENCQSEESFNKLLLNMIHETNQK